MHSLLLLLLLVLTRIRQDLSFAIRFIEASSFGFVGLPFDLPQEGIIEPRPAVGFAGRTAATLVRVTTETLLVGTLCAQRVGPSGFKGTFRF